MKRSLLFLLTALLTLSLFSCSKDEDPKPEENEVEEIFLSSFYTNLMVQLDWDHLEGVDYYNVYFAEKGNDLEKIATIDEDGDRIRFTINEGIQGDTEYHVKVKGYNADSKVIGSSGDVVFTTPE
ncbi:hypothetical protein RCC89_03230 [Cytophagaceae bacterium ABcell3]|nr:hypothetical protein RCC89_03230 [Cytophagaceae bacterium ABcell3]